MSLGTGTPQIGSWVCRADEKLVVNVIWALYQPQTVDGISDIILVRNSRDSYVFAITDNNTLTREAFRARRYMPTQDLTDPTAVPCCRSTQIRSCTRE